jgi:hypothetical protein
VEEERRRLGVGDRTGEAAAYSGPDGGKMAAGDERTAAGLGRVRSLRGGVGISVAAA